MHIPTHILSGWCVANLFELTPRERLCCMFAASMADLDGISYVFGESAYHATHKLLGHNLPVALVVSIALALGATHRMKTFLLSLFLAHLHLVMDYYGSGPHWPTYYLWPVNWEFKIINKDAWPFFSWQNISIAMAFILWMLVIAVRCRRTPVELITPRLDREFVRWLRDRVGRSHVARATAQSREPPREHPQEQS